MEVSRAVLNYLRGKTNVYTNPFSCLCLPLCCTEQKRSVSEREAWEILDERKEEENSLKFSDKKRELCSVFPCMCVCVCLYLKKKIVVQSNREGWDIVLLSSYFLLSCVCLWKGGGHKKREGRELIFSRYSMWFYLTRCTASDGQLSSFSFCLVYFLGDSECEVSLSISPFSLWLTVTSAPLLSACLHSYLWNDEWAQDS